jgi:hypothetical protein
MVTVEMAESPNEGITTAPLSSTAAMKWNGVRESGSWSIARRRWPLVKVPLRMACIIAALWKNAGT